MQLSDGCQLPHSEHLSTLHNILWRFLHFNSTEPGYEARTEYIQWVTYFIGWKLFMESHCSHITRPHPRLFRQLLTFWISNFSRYIYYRYSYQYQIITLELFKLAYCILLWLFICCYWWPLCFITHIARKINLHYYLGDVSCLAYSELNSLPHKNN